MHRHLILSDWQPVCSSGQIALYPSLASRGDGFCACAWYEYTSADRPSRSDVWFSERDGRGVWGNPVNISQGLSYNNGPSLMACGESEFLVAWHSWRPPGRDPFLAGGDVRNIWLSRRRDAQWSTAVLAFPELSQTKYASLACVHGRFSLACCHRETSRILLSESNDGLSWNAPCAFPCQTGQAGFPSLAALPDGTLLLAFTLAGHDGIWLSKRTKHDTWTEPQCVCEMHGEKLGKPKLSVDSRGAMWIACQTEHWGFFERSYRVRSSDQPFVEIEFGTRGGAGNTMWTLNALDFSDASGVPAKSIRFGPEPDRCDPAVTYVSVGDWRYSAARGCGFDAPVEELLRELGSEITRRLVFCSEQRRLRVDLPSGEYVMKVTNSSWVASRPALELKVNCAFEEIAPTPGASDRCFFFRCPKDGEFQLVASTPVHQEHNRPAAVCEVNSDSHLAAWTSFEGEAVQIVSQILTIP